MKVQPYRLGGVFIRVGDAPEGHRVFRGTVPPRGRGRRESVPVDTPSPKRVVLEGDVAQTVREAAARTGLPASALVREAVCAYTSRPSEELLRRYLDVRDDLARLGADDRLLNELDRIVLLTWTRILRGGRR